MNIVYSNGNGFFYQWDYGQKIQITGVDIPDSYEVHFATGLYGDSIAVTGDSTGVMIPDELLEKGKDILAWVFVKTETTGLTKYSFTINVKKRAKPTEPRPEIIPAEGVDF